MGVILKQRPAEVVVDIERVPGPDLRKVLQAIVDELGMTILRDERGEYSAEAQAHGASKVS